MKVIAVVCEAYSENLGDAFIYEEIALLLEEMGFSVVCVDLSGRRGFGQTLGSAARDRAGLTNRIRRFFSRFGFLRRLVTLLRWSYWGRRDFLEYCVGSLRGVDGVIIGGGQIITDTNLEFPVRIKEVVKVCRKLNKPYGVFSVGVGDKLSFYARLVYSALFKSAGFISVRGSTSALRAKSLSPSGAEILVNPDPVYHCFYSTPSRPCLDFEGRSFGINVISFSVFKRFVPEFGLLDEEFYYQFWLKVVRSISSRGGVCSLFTNGDNNDYLEASRVFDYLTENSDLSVELLRCPDRPQDLVLDMQKMDFVIATRMHAGIKAYALGKAVVPIGWDIKVEEVWDNIGFKGVVHPSVVLSDDPWSVLENSIAINQHIGAVKSSSGLDVASALGLCVKKLLT